MSNHCGLSIEDCGVSHLEFVSVESAIRNPQSAFVL